MQDPRRIGILLSEFQKLWLTNPDWTFGQLVSNLHAYRNITPNIFNCEDTVWLEAIQAMNGPGEGLLDASVVRNIVDNNKKLLDDKEYADDVARVRALIQQAMEFHKYTCDARIDSDRCLSELINKYHYKVVSVANRCFKISWEEKE